MKVLRPASLTLLTLIFYLFSCNESEEINVFFTEDDLLWLPYDSINILIFESTNNELDTVYVNKEIHNVFSWCESMFCPKIIYQPASGYVNFHNDRLMNISLSITKRTQDEDITGKLTFKSRTVSKSHNIFNYYRTDAVLIDSIMYDSVFVYDAAQNFGLENFYFKKGLGFIKFEFPDSVIWHLKEIY